MVGRLHEPLRSIGEVAESLDLPQHVLRFWETRFKEIDPVKRAGGRRLYRQRDVDILGAIRHLLYSEGYTIKGVQRILKEQGVNAVVDGVTQRMRDAPLNAPGAGGAAPPAGDTDDAEPELETPEAAEADESELAEAPPAEAAPLPVPAQLVEAPEPAPAPRLLDEDDARPLRAALAEIDECRRLLRLTIR